MTQNHEILALLKQGPVTPIQALNQVGCFRLAARIHDLKGMGHDITTRMIVSGKKRFAMYTIESLLNMIPELVRFCASSFQIPRERALKLIS